MGGLGGERADSLSHSFPFPVKHMGAPTALPSGRRAPGRREKRRDPARPSHCRRGSRPGGASAAGPCRRGAPRAESHPASLTPHKGRRAPEPHLPAPYLLPRRPLRAQAARPGTQRRPAACPPAALGPRALPGPRQARARQRRPARRPGSFPPRAPLRPAGPLRELRRGGPRSCELLHGRGPPQPPTPTPTLRAVARIPGRGPHSLGGCAGLAGPGAAAPSLLSALRAPPDWLGPSSPPPSARRQPAPSLLPPPPAVRRAQLSRGRAQPGKERPRATAGPGDWAWACGRARERRGGRARAGASARWPRPGPAPPAPPASGP